MIEQRQSPAGRARWPWRLAPAEAEAESCRRLFSLCVCVCVRERNSICCTTLYVLLLTKLQMYLVLKVRVPQS